MLDRIVEWFTVEPTISLLMTIAAIVIFSSALAKAHEPGVSFWPWLRRLLEASIGAILFVGLLWAFRSILNNNNSTFNSTHGSLSEINRQSAYSIWGRPHYQQELSVQHFIEKTVQEEIPQADPSQPPLYKNTVVREEVLQNSITGFIGNVAMTLNEREKGYALYSGYVVDANLQYNIINDSDLTTETDFLFPLSPGQTLYNNFKITMDNQDLSSQLHIGGDVVQWQTTMTPHQQSTIVVVYQSRGMDTFTYQIPTQREIKNFALTLTVDRLPVSLLNYPGSTLTPSEVKPTPDGRGSILSWKLDGAITAAGMGVALQQPEQPGADVLRVLWNSPYALSLLGAMLALTLIIRGQPVRFLDLALIASAYCVQFLIMAATSDWVLGFWGSLILGAAFTGFLTFLLYRKVKSRLLKILIYGLVAFFTVAYPLSGLLTDSTQRNSFEGLVQVGLIVYLFGLSLYTRLEQAPLPLQPAPVQEL